MQKLKLLKNLRHSFFYLLACALLAGVLFSRASVFRVSNLEIEVEDGRIRELVTKKLISHLGGSLLSVPVSNVERELLKIPKVKNVRIMRRWPNALGIKVELKQAIGKFKSKTGIYLVDEQGLVLEKLEGESGHPWLVGFYDPASGNPKLSEVQLKGVLGWVFGLQNQKSLSPIEITQIDQIEWVPGSGLSFQLGPDLDLKIDLGFENWDSAWGRVLGLWSKDNFKPSLYDVLDASYSNRIVAKKRRELPKAPNELNLEELVRRGEVQVSPEAR